MKAWFGDRLVDSDDSTVGVALADHGLLVGDGIFETMKVVDGVAFALRRHLDRLHRSAIGLGLAPPDVALVREAVEAVIAANEPGAGRVRVTYTSGPGPLGSTRGDGRPSLTVLVGPAATWDPTAAVVVVPWVRNERSAAVGLKTTSYAENVIALARAHELGASEAIFANTVGQLCEGTGSNIFVGRDGQLLTPTLASGCLAGVTRELLLSIGHGTEVDMPLTDLASCSEAFLASSTRDVQPIATIDGRPVPEAPGPLTRAAADAFAALVARDLDP